MAAPSSLLLAALTFVLLLPMSVAGYPGPPPMFLTIVNNCPFTIWPAIQANAGRFPPLPLPEGGGFMLPSLGYRTFRAPDGPWSGRIWARTGCCVRPNGRFSCDTGDCGPRIACGGNGGAVPATLAQISLHMYWDKISYGVSLVDGFNLPLTVTPHEGRGVCPVVGCRANLLPGCPWPLRVWRPGQVVGCKSACTAFGTDQHCCRNAFSAPGCCRPSGYSSYFKQACPATYTFAQDRPSLQPDCAAPRELKFIFCH